MKSIEQINHKIKNKQAVILTAKEFKALAETKSPDELADQVDVVTTATFGPMCSSGVFFNFGHTDPPMRMEQLSLNGVGAYGGIAAVDAYLGATETSPDNPSYGGSHVIESLLKGESVQLKAKGKGTDCYPRKEIVKDFRLEDINEAILFNPRNAYQNYGAAVNTGNKTLYTYMGTLLPKKNNVNYSTSGELSPLLNDPEFRTIGIGTRIFLGGAEGYIAWNGTQFFTGRLKNENGIPLAAAATLAVVGNLKEMSADFIKAAYYEKYGTSMFVGIGIPIPVIDARQAHLLSIRNKDIETTLFDYALPDRPVLGIFNYEQLMSGKIIVQDRQIRTASLSSISKAQEICECLKQRMEAGIFLLSEPVGRFPQVNQLNKLN